MSTPSPEPHNPDPSTSSHSSKARAHATGLRWGRRLAFWRQKSEDKAFSRSWSWLVEPAWKWNAEEGPKEAAALAFYAIFSLAPTLVAAVAVASLVLGPQAAAGALSGRIVEVVGPDAGNLIESVIAQAWSTQLAKGAGFWAVIGALIGASAGFASLSHAINSIWGAQAQTQSAWIWVRGRLLSFALAIAIGGGLLALMAIQAALGAVGHLLTPQPLDPISTWIAQNTVLLIAIGSGFLVLLKVLPQPSVKWRHAALGASCCAVLLLLGKSGFALYLSHVGAVSAFGAAGTLAALLLWLWFAACVALFGAQVSRCAQLREEGHPWRGAIEIGKEASPSLAPATPSLDSIESTKPTLPSTSTMPLPAQAIEKGSKSPVPTRPWNRNGE